MAYLAELLKNYGALTYRNSLSYVQGFLRYFSGGVSVAAPPGLEGMASLQSKFSLLNCPQPLQFIKDALLQAYNLEMQEAQQKEFQVYPEVTKDNLDYWRQAVQAVPEVYRKWLEVRFALDTQMLQGLNRVWYNGGALTPEEEQALRKVYNSYPFGQGDFNVWLKVTLKQIYVTAVTTEGFSSNETTFYHLIYMLQSNWFAVQEFRLEVYTQWAKILLEYGIDPAKEGFTAL